MKLVLPYLLAAVFVAAFAVQCRKNRTLRDDLSRTRAELEAARTAIPDVPQRPARPVAAPLPAPAPEAPAPSAPTFDREKFDKAVEARVEERIAAREAERAAEREARRRAWENETEEQRAARRQEFQARMREYAGERIAEFVEKTGLDEAQQAAFQGEMEILDARVREIADTFTGALEEGVPAGFETQMHLLNEMSAAVLDAYAGLDESLPEGWRERDEGFALLLGISPEAGEALFRAMRRSGGFRPGGPGGPGPFPGGFGGPGGPGGPGPFPDGRPPQ